MPTSSSTALTQRLNDMFREIYSEPLYRYRQDAAIFGTDSLDLYAPKEYKVGYQLYEYSPLVEGTQFKLKFDMEYV